MHGDEGCTLTVTHTLPSLPSFFPLVSFVVSFFIILHCQGKQRDTFASDPAAPSPDTKKHWTGRIRFVEEVKNQKTVHVKKENSD